MKIEKINDNQIRCTLFRSDLISRQIKISELASNTGKARELFRDMMKQAQEDFGFEAEDMPLMIEAMPGSSDGLVLIITRVDDPAELDNKFANFSNNIDFDAADMMDMEDIEELTSEIDNLTGIMPQPGVSEPVYRFSNLRDVIKAAHALNRNFTGKNSLYKTQHGDYYILIHDGGSEGYSLALLCDILSEFGSLESVLIDESYFIEHCDCLIYDNALQTLSAI
ncbi:MAG: adaptor protein MecA [Eubacterium sp.]